jgi:hypothetical protein
LAICLPRLQAAAAFPADFPAGFPAGYWPMLALNPKRLPDKPLKWPKYRNLPLSKNLPPLIAKQI